MNSVKTKSFQEIEALILIKRNGGAMDITFIDTRDPDEREGEGHIPRSINIPAYELPGAFKMRGSPFSKKYGTAKPGKKSEIILYCRNGQRSYASGMYLVNQGYEKVSILNGGYAEWEKNARLADDADL